MSENGRFAYVIETKQTWRTIREIGLCNMHKNTSCQMDPNDLNECGLTQVSIVFIAVMLILIMVPTLIYLSMTS